MAAQVTEMAALLTYLVFDRSEAHGMQERLVARKTEVMAKLVATSSLRRSHVFS